MVSHERKNIHEELITIQPVGEGVKFTLPERIRNLPADLHAAQQEAKAGLSIVQQEIKELQKEDFTKAAIFIGVLAGALTLLNFFREK